MVISSLMPLPRRQDARTPDRIFLGVCRSSYSMNDLLRRKRGKPNKSLELPAKRLVCSMGFINGLIHYV